MAAMARFLLLALVAMATVVVVVHVVEAARQLTFEHLGCYIESEPANRDLVGLKRLTQLGPYPVSSPAEGLTSIAGMTLEMCSQLCSLGGFPYFGVQYGSFCSCDVTYGSFGNASEAECSLNCVGNLAQKCGESYRNSMKKVTYLDNNSFQRVQDASSVVVRVSPGYSVNTGSLAQSKQRSDCLVECQKVGSWCQAIIYIPGCCCHLLRFAALPESMAGTQGEMWVRV